MESLFIAIKLEAAPRLITLVRNTQVLMRKERIRWIPDLDMHIKLASISSIGMCDTDSVRERLKSVAEGMTEFITTIRGFGNIGSHSLSAGVDQTPEFLMLRHKINDVLGEFKEPDSIDFVPNVLIARINSLIEKRLFFKLVDANRLIEFDDLRVKEVCLMSTELKSYGPTLKIEDRFSLQDLKEEIVA